MLIRTCSNVTVFLGILRFCDGAAAGSGQTDAAKQPATETVAKLVAQLGAADFRTREQASAGLEKFGAPVLPALRKAAKANIELEVKRRIEIVATRIENALLKTEEKHWQALDAPRRGIKDRLRKILARAPLSDDQVTAAVYLLSVGRPATEGERKQARKQIGDAHSRPLGVLQLTRALVQGKEFCVTVAAANVRLVKAQKELAAAPNLAAALALLNGPEFQKLTTEAAKALQAVKPNERAVEVAFLLTLSQFPTASQAQVAAAHLQRARDRPRALEDVFWAVMNTKEFLQAP